MCENHELTQHLRSALEHALSCMECWSILMVKQCTMAHVWVFQHERSPTRSGHIFSKWAQSVTGATVPSKSGKEQQSNCYSFVAEHFGVNLEH